MGAAIFFAIMISVIVFLTVVVVFAAPLNDGTDERIRIDALEEEVAELRATGQVEPDGI